MSLDPHASAAPAPALFPHLSAPFALGGIALRNRIAHASITTRYPHEQRVTERLIGYHAERARGGCALIVTEPLAVISWQRDEPHKVRAYDDAEIDGLTRWVAAVEAHDCRLLGQIQDSGRGMHHRGRKPYCYGPSALPDDLSGTVPHVLSGDQVAAAVDDIAAAARRMQRAGFSGVEVSAGHGHLFHQFMSPQSNHRDDRYGGDLEGRMRFLTDTLSAIRAATTRPFILAVKLPGDDGVPGGIGLDAAEAILQRLVALGLGDAYAFAQGAHHRSLETHMPDLHTPRACYNDLVKRLRGSAGGVPVAALGRLLDAVLAEKALSDGVGDYVQIGRPMITDAAWAARALAGQEARSRQCVSCNSCWGVIADRRPIACDNNPRLGTPNEAFWAPAKTAAPKQVVVVGAGVAGLECAWVAAQRGHAVTVIGSGHAYGGKAALVARLPGMDQISSVYDYQVTAARSAGVRFALGQVASADDVLALHPDHVVLATGSTMAWPAGWPVEWRDEGWVTDLRSTVLALERPAARQPGTAIVFDLDQTTGVCAAATLLAQRFERVVIVTPLVHVALEEPLVVQQSTLKRLSLLPVQVLGLTELSGESDLAEGWVELKHVYSSQRTRIEDVALITYATPRVPNLGLLAPLRAAALPVSMIGDCYAPRALLYATAEGHALGNSV